MNKAYRELYDYIKDRYDLYLQNPKKNDLLMYILTEEQADVLKSAGFERKTVLMRSETPAALKVLENAKSKYDYEELSLF